MTSRLGSPLVMYLLTVSKAIKGHTFQWESYG